MKEVHTDHLPIVFKFNPQSLLAQRPASHDVSSHSDLHSADKIEVTSHHAQDFCTFLHDNLPSIPDELVGCCDPECSHHRQQLDSICIQVLECIQSGSSLCLPEVKKHRHLISGWNTHACSLKKSATSWHKVWYDSGCPSSGVLFQIKKNSKKQFKYEVRRLRRQQEHIRREQLGSALSQSRSNDFWKVVRNITKSTHCLLYTSPSPRDATLSRMPSSA